jgi:serine/threonine protein kinase/cytochrome b561
MDTKRICSGCQKPLAPNAPDGLCPECLIKAGLGTGVDIGPDSQGEGGRTPFVAPTLEEVARLFPQLEIVGFIGQGGMGAVYKARQKALDRVVALKILPPGIGKDPAFAERFTREAKALARLNHPGVVTLYEFGQADGLFYFLMEFVDGVNLRHLLEAGRLSPREALAIVPQICDALQYAHDQGIVHRDIKPENILLDRQGRVKVADFGLAKLVGTEGEPSAEGGGVASSVVLTEAGKVMGTPQYMAPEQREHPAEVDHRADIYSLGVVFYQMLTGELPGKRIEPPSHTVRVDVRLDEVVLRALEKEPERRYQQVSQMKSAVETIATTPPPRIASEPAGASHTNAQPSADKLSPWCRIVGIALNGTFTSPLAIKLVNTSALGFLGALAFLGFVPLPRMHGCFGFAGFCGFFGLISVASIIELSSRRKGGGPAAMQRCFVVVGRRSGKAVIHWPGVLLSFVLTLAIAEAGAIMASLLLFGRIDERSVGMVFMFAVMLVGILIKRGRATPVEQLTALDGPGGTGPKPAGRKWPAPLVGLRNGQRVIHWPGLLLFAVSIVAVAGAVSLILSLLLPVQVYALHPRGLVVGLLVGFLLLVIRLQGAWTTPIERLPRLDGPPDRVGSTWKVAAIVVTVLVLILTVPLGVWFLAGSSEKVAVRHVKSALVGTRAMTFGPEVNGLRAALELISPKGVFALGQPIEVLFHIRNTSSTNIYVAGGSWRQDDAHHITIEDQQGRQIPVQHIFYTVRTPTQRNLVLPGESAVFHSSGLAFLAKDADGKQVRQPVGNYVKVTPGRYTVRYRLHFPDLEQRGFPEPSDWQGDLDTAPVTVEVTAGNRSAAAPAFGPVVERVVVGSDLATLEGQGRPGFSLVLSLGDTTNRWECRFPNDTRFTAMFRRATQQGFSWAVSDRAGKVLFATTVTQFGGEDFTHFNQGVIVFREGTLAPEPDGSFVIAWFELGNGGLVPMAVRLVQAPASSKREQAAQSRQTEDPGEVFVAGRNVADVSSNLSGAPLCLDSFSGELRW